MWSVTLLHVTEVTDVSLVEEECLCRGQEEGAHPCAAHADAHGQGLPLVEMFSHSHHSRDVHQAWRASDHVSVKCQYCLTKSEASDEAVGEQQDGEARAVAGEDEARG